MKSKMKAEAAPAQAERNLIREAYEIQNRREMAELARHGDKIHARLAELRARSGQHTPGPWVARTYPDARGEVVAIKVWSQSEFTGNQVCGIVAADCTGNLKEDCANARLIAAAPEMLATLKWIAKQDPFAPIGTNPTRADIIAHARHTVALATGKGETQ